MDDINTDSFTELEGSSGSEYPADDISTHEAPDNDAENVNNNSIHENDTSLTDLRERVNHRRKSAQTNRMKGVEYEGFGEKSDWLEMIYVTKGVPIPVSMQLVPALQTNKEKSYLKGIGA